MPKKPDSRPLVPNKPVIAFASPYSSQLLTAKALSSELDCYYLEIPVDEEMGKRSVGLTPDFLLLHLNDFDESTFIRLANHLRQHKSSMRVFYSLSAVESALDKISMSTIWPYMTYNSVQTSARNVDQLFGYMQTLMAPSKPAGGRQKGERTRLPGQ